ncbi:nAChRa7 [Bugula neritina]|uniref:NAChRa7 n=1 Tax=Bugula neritina TaxID=10212 RepID=A0A7J7KCD7_BUGNE|nr:nAChRa7 [Bugula neritina]
MNSQRIACFLLILVTLATDVSAGPDQRRLLEDLFSDYNKHERPVYSESEPVAVEFQVSLRSILNVDEANQQLQTQLWLNYAWKDYKFRWEPSSYGNITDIRYPAASLWLPDITMYNSIASSEIGSKPDVFIASEGSVSLVQPGIFTSSCETDLRWFPFDTQACKLTFGSWTLDGSKVDLKVKNGVSMGSLDGYQPNQEWHLLNFSVVRNTVYFECCPDTPYIDLDYTLKISRLQLFYVINIIIPSIFIALLTLVTFIIPVQSGEKLSFGSTVLLILAIFWLLLINVMPSTSASVSVPMLTIFLGFISIVNVLSLTCAAIVVRLHHSSALMPRVLKSLFCETLAPILCIGTNKPRKPLYESVPTNVRSPEPANFCAEKPVEHSLQNSGVSLQVLQSILHELSAVSVQMKAKEQTEQNTADWMIAGAVLDRLFFIAYFLGLFIGCMVIGLAN